MRILIAAVAALVIAGCAQQVRTVEVPKETIVPRPVPCVDPADVPAAPQFPTEAQILAMPDYQATHALFAAFMRALGYIEELEPIARACSRLPALKFHMQSN